MDEESEELKLPLHEQQQLHGELRVREQEEDDLSLPLSLVHDLVLQAHGKFEELSKFDKEEFHKVAAVARNVVAQTIIDIDPFLDQVHRAWESVRNEVTAKDRDPVTLQLKYSVLGLGYEYFLTKGLPTIVEDLFHVRIDGKDIVEELNQFFRRVSATSYQSLCSRLQGLCCEDICLDCSTRLQPCCIPTALPRCCYVRSRWRRQKYGQAMAGPCLLCCVYSCDIVSCPHQFVWVSNAKD